MYQSRGPRTEEGREIELQIFSKGDLIAPMDETKKELIKDAACPHCNTAPLVFGSKEITTNQGLVIALLWCAHCGYTLNVHVIGKQAPVDIQALLGQKPGGKLVRM